MVSRVSRVGYTLSLYDLLGQAQVKLIVIVKVRELTSTEKECCSTRDCRWLSCQPFDRCKCLQELLLKHGRAWLLQWQFEYLTRHGIKVLDCVTFLDRFF
jgi:hypothetical protein